MQIWETDSQEAENKRKALIITIIVNVLVLLAIFFIVVWREQVPPLPKYGMELNLGFTDFGSGNNQTTSPPSEAQTPNTQTPAPGDQAPKPVEATVPVTQPKTEAAKPASSPAKPTVEALSKTPSPVKASEKPTPAVKDPSPAKKETTPVTQPSVSEAEKTTTKAEEKPKIDQRAIFGASGTTGSGSQPAAGSAQGSSTQKGDEGKPTGTIDGRANTGIGSGYNLELGGWEVASTPNLNDHPSDRNGFITFAIIVNDFGKVETSTLVQTNITDNHVINHFRNKLKEFSLKRSTQGQIAEFSRGKITFTIKMN